MSKELFYKSIFYHLGLIKVKKVISKYRLNINCYKMFNKKNVNPFQVENALKGIKLIKTGFKIINIHPTPVFVYF